MKILKKTKQMISSPAGAVLRQAKILFKAASKRIESLTAISAIFLIWRGVGGYDKRLALIVTGAILIIDIWYDKLLRRKSK